MTNVLRGAFPGGLTDLAIVLGLQAFTFAFGFSTQSLSTMATLCMAMVGMMVLWQVCKPFDWKRRSLWGGVAAALAFCVLFLRDFFSLSVLGLQEVLVLGVFWCLCWPVMRSILTAFEKGRRLFERLRGRRRQRRGRRAA